MICGGMRVARSDSARHSGLLERPDDVEEDNPSNVAKHENGRNPAGADNIAS